MNNTREQIDAVWALMRASEKMAIIGTHWPDGPNREPFDEAYEERNLALAKVMRLFRREDV